MAGQPVNKAKDYKQVEYWACFSPEHRFNRYGCITPEMLKGETLILSSKIGRLVVDGHIHCGKKDVTKGGAKVTGVNQEVESVDNSAEALFGVGEFSPGSLGCVRDRPTKMERFKEW